MSIDFHCPYCNAQIKAPNNTGGKKGRCPSCKQSVYIPPPADDLDEFDLAPLDEDDEKQRRQMVHETIETQRAAHAEKSEDDNKPQAEVRLPTHADDIPSLVIQYLVAMSESKLEDSERIADKLSEHKRPAVKYIKQLSSDDSRPPELAHIPEPLLQGFLKTLRSQL